MSEPQMIIVTRGRGRPKAAEETSPVSFRALAKHHDLLARLADERSTSVSAVVRGIVETACEVIERRRRPR